MDHITHEQRKAQQQAGKDDLIQYIEELANPEEYPPGDAWISLTDAARVTRTSEAMARRWVTSGRLAVKKDAVGIPPRTRLVRLSDVAKIRPIIDPSAAITGDTRKLDLPSIPRQQLQIMEEHQRLLARAETLQHAVDQFIIEIHAQVQQGLDDLETRLTALQEQASSTLGQRLAEGETSLKNLADQLAKQDQEQQHRLQEASACLQEAIDCLEGKQKEQQKHIDILHREKTALLKMHINDTKAIRQDLTTEVQTREQLGRVLVEAEQRQQAALEEQAQEQRQFQGQLETLERNQAQDVAMLTARLDTLVENNAWLDATIKNVKALAEEDQHRVIAQEQRLDTLQQELEQEREARHKLEEGLETEQKERARLSQRLQVLVQNTNALHINPGKQTIEKRKKL